MIWTALQHLKVYLFPLSNQLWEYYLHLKNDGKTAVLNMATRMA